MTLFVELKVGSQPIGTASITNLGHPTGGDRETDDLRRYSYALLPHSTTRTGIPAAKGYVEHRRGDGAWELVRKVLTDADLEPLRYRNRPEVGHG